MIKVKEVPVGRFRKERKLPTIEETGNGQLLCLEGYGGRLFRSSEEAVKKAIKQFVDNYLKACRMFDEDPAHMYFEVFNFNDLYSMLGIAPTDFGDQFGYSNVDGYRIDDLDFEITLVDHYKSEFLEIVDEPVLIFEPRYDCYPNEFYREV